jgi:hypothetical protein
MYEPMNDTASQLSEPELAELCALADGTLPADRRAEVEARVSASPELQELLARQRQAVALARSLETDEPSASLQAAVEARGRELRQPRPRRRWLAPRLALAAGLAVAATVLLAIVLTGGPGAPSVAEAARLATKPPTEPAPPPLGGSESKLALDVQGVTFPDLARAFGWQTVGARRGRVDGRDAMVVYYRKGERQIAYVIVAGDGLPRPSGGQTTAMGGIPYQTVRLNDKLAVTWRRGGHTCVLVGDAAGGELVALASWAVN